MFAYLSVFFVGLLASTLVPLPSEAALIGFAHQGYSLGLLWLSASTGNILGACLNYLIGWYLSSTQYFKRAKEHNTPPVNCSTLSGIEVIKVSGVEASKSAFSENRWGKSQKYFNKFGYWCLAFSWLPIIGDGFTFVAGFFRTKFVVFLVLVSLGKAARYGIVLYLAH